MAEPSAVGNIGGMGPSGGIPTPDISGATSRTSVNALADINIPKVDKLGQSIKFLRTEIGQLKKVMAEFANSGVAAKLSAQYTSMTKAGTAAAQAAAAQIRGVVHTQAAGFGGSQPTVWQTRGQKDPAETVRIAMGAMGGGIGGGGGRPPSSATSSASGDSAGGRTLGQGVANAAGNFVSNITGQNGILPMVTSAFTGAQQLWGSLAGGSLQYAYNRINGPGGNMNAMLQLAQSLAPNATMMSAATGQPMSIQKMIEGLGQRMPIMGTQQDMLSTIQAGQSVGALMAGTPGRNGFFESARQAQALMPGQAPATIAGNIAGYLGNVQSQKMGVMFGEGAFTMVGSGGRYKTLAEWAEGITKFFEQHRPGGQQGKGFTPEELISQNFPGSNINAWFQMMGVPQNMVDYWWQYVLTNTSGTPASQVTSQTLQKMTQQTRGINLGFEQLRTSTASTQRDYLMGNQMYGMYALNASANRRFNVAMQGTDQALAKTLQDTNIGRMIALLPTPIMEMLLPIFTQLFSSPVGATASAIGGLLGDPDRSSMPYGAVGGYGEAGGTTTAHLSPDLAKRVNAMMAANPKLQISSGYRDTVTQNRLRRNGATAVGSPGKSAHTRGWAVDIGPASQMGWLMGNASKYGLSTAANYGEPWHIQRAGTPMGDPGAMPYGDIFGDALSIGKSAFNMVTDPIGALTGLGSSALSGIAGEFGKAIMWVIENITKTLAQLMADPLQKLLDKFVGGGGFTSMVDTATNLFSKLMTAPLAGFAQIGGKASGGLSDVQSLINQPGPTSVSVIGSGFTSSGTGTSTTPIFGDPMPYGGPIDMMAHAAAMRPVAGPTIIIHAPISIAATLTSGADARRVAATLTNHLEAEVLKRQWMTT